ncbi:MAG: hypothetical protein H6583_07290 [Alteromonas sp.]|nr:hypothetical protein [Alteromonas sp.]
MNATRRMVQGSTYCRGMLGAVVISLVLPSSLSDGLSTWYGTATFSGFLNGGAAGSQYLALLISVVVTAIFYRKFTYRFTQRRK